MIDDQYVSQLLVADGVCFGALAFDLETGARTVFLADAVVLAAGGHTRIWRRSSSRRDENTGAHQRRDHPELSPELRVNFQTRLDADGRLTTATEPVPPIPPDLQALADATQDVSVAGRLLE